MKKLKTFDSIYSCGKSHFEEDGTKNWLVFQPIHRYFKLASDNPSIILSWRSKGWSDYVSDYSTIENCLFGAVKLTKHVNVDKYKYSGYGLGFDMKGFFSICDEIGRNVIIFGVDMSSSLFIDNKKKDILIIDKCHTQGLEHTLAVEKMYSINFTEHFTKFCLSLHYNGANSYLFVNGT